MDRGCLQVARDKVGEDTAVVADLVTADEDETSGEEEKPYFGPPTLHDWWHSKPNPWEKEWDCTGLVSILGVNNRNSLVMVGFPTLVCYFAHEHQY